MKASMAALLTRAERFKMIAQYRKLTPAEQNQFLSWLEDCKRNIDLTPEDRQAFDDVAAFAREIFK